MSTPDPSVRFPEGTRWDCRACGACCRGYEFGPVSDEIVAGLEALDVEAHWAPAAEHGWRFRRPGPDGAEAWYLNKVDDHCVFLREDNLCAVHALFGAEAKPAFCREFPFHLVEDPTGLVAIVRSDCGGFHESFRDGTPIEAHLDEIVALPRTIPMRRFAPDAVALLPGVAVALSDWPDLEARLLAALEGEPVDPEVGVGRLREVIGASTGRPPSPDPDKGRLALRALLAAIRMVMDKVLATDQSAATAHQLAFAERMSGVVDRVTARADAPLPPLSADARDWLHLVLRGFVASKQFAASGSLGAGLGGFLAGVTVARLAAEPSGGTLSAAVVSAELSAWNRFTANGTIAWVLDKARPALVDVYRHGI